MANIIDAIINLVKNDDFQMKSHHVGTNRANMAGDSLEDFIKDLFAGTIGLDEKTRLMRLSEVFSYSGNSANPPDAMLRGGDAIEIKKIESDNSSLALNSSYPKHTLKCTNPMISAACRNAEDWKEKEMVYAVGVVKRGTNTLKHLCMVYGRNYCASEKVYKRTSQIIQREIESLNGIVLTPYSQLDYISELDPIGLNSLIAHKMWSIKNPWTMFDYIYQIPHDKKFTFMCIINEDKWCSLSNRDEIIELSTNKAELSISDEYTKSPDNPNQFDKVKLISYYK